MRFCRSSVVKILLLAFVVAVCMGCALAPTESRAVVQIYANGKLFTYKDEFIEPSDFVVAEQIEQRRINAPLENKIELVDEYLRNGADYKTALEICFPLLRRTVEKVANEVYVAPTDSSVAYSDGRFYATPSKAGRILDENKAYLGIYYCLKYGVKDKVTAETKAVKPDVTQEQLKRRLVERGRYSTDYSFSTYARAHNVTLALKKVDGIKIARGEVFSFNRAVGERTEKRGFKKAKIIQDGKYTEGVGGGVCQASTAVYNAALLSGLDCVANAHSIAPSYCPPGLDAMISGCSDLLIRNGTDSDVYIYAKSDGKNATVAFYGAPREYDVVPRSVVIKTVAREIKEQVDEDYSFFSSDAQSGDKMLVSAGRDGIISETYADYYKNGVLVKSAKLRQNVYSSAPQIIAVAP